MSIKISLSEQEAELKPRILVFGAGGAGGNAVNNMINAGLEGVEFWIANTDSQALSTALASNKLQLGINATKGLGAGSYPEVGRAAAEESVDELKSAIRGCNMIFITAGMGGGTGTGAVPIIAQLAKEEGALVVGVVTKPFHFEGARRMKIAEAGLEQVSKFVDTLIVIPNQNLFRIANEKTTFMEAFKMADDVLHSGVRSVTDLITMPGIVNLDFADIKAVMQEMGRAMMGTGEAEGENRAIRAAEAAISNPLLDNSSMKGAKGVLINISGGLDMTLFEVDEAANRIKEEVEAGANIIFGSSFSDVLNGKLRISVVATGIDYNKHKAHYNQSSQKQHSVEQINHNQEHDEEDATERENDQSSFIPQQAYTPEDMIHSVVDDAEKSNTLEVENTTNSLLHRVSVSHRIEEQHMAKTQKDKRNSLLFEIPAFLRKKTPNK